MEQLDIEKIEQILGNTKCEEGLACVNHGLEEICKAKVIGVEKTLACLENDQFCTFSLPFGYGCLCKCPVRHYIKTELGK
jgi:hypothetical protein